MPSLMLFAYGTLQDADVLGALVGKIAATTSRQPARAPGFAIVTYPGRTYPALVPSPTSVAQGTLIGALDAFDLAIIDAFEGDEYQRILIPIQIPTATFPAFAYLPTIQVPLAGSPWSLAGWTNQHKQAFLQAERPKIAALRLSLSRP
jgi:gamma-glutamylcyclotransferase (GGCT)/AIG2-like uncharacterized protein YtfP